MSRISAAGRRPGPVPAYGNGRGSSYGAERRQRRSSEFDSRHYNYEDESQEVTRISSSSHGSTPKSKSPEGGGNSIDNIARFFGGRGVNARLIFAAHHPAPMDIPEPTGAAGLKKGQRVRHSKYGEGTIVMREGDGDDAKLTVLFQRHGMKKLMEKFANLEKI